MLTNKNQNILTRLVLTEPSSDLSHIIVTTEERLMREVVTEDIDVDPNIEITVAFFDQGGYRSGRVLRFNHDGTMLCETDDSYKVVVDKTMWFPLEAKYALEQAGFIKF